MGYKNMRETPPEMQRVLFCIVTHKMFSPARQIVRVIRDIRAKIIQAKRVAKVAYPSIITRLIQEAKVTVLDDGPFEKVPPNVTIRADRTPPLVVFQDQFWGNKNEPNFVEPQWVERVQPLQGRGRRNMV